jgi:hypothetical protein
MKNSFAVSVFNRSKDFYFMREVGQLSENIGTWAVATNELESKEKLSYWLKRTTTQIKFSHPGRLDMPNPSYLLREMYAMEHLLAHPIFHSALVDELESKNDQIANPFTFSIGIADTPADKYDGGLLISPRAYLKYNPLMSEARVVTFDNEHMESTDVFAPSVSVYRTGEVKNSRQLYSNVTEMLKTIFKTDFDGLEPMDMDIFRLFCSGQLKLMTQTV